MSKFDLSWVRCNRCMDHFVQSKSKFYLSNCSHIYCENCLERSIRPKCFVCSMENSRWIQLETNLAPQLWTHFSPLDHQVVNQLMVAFKFQESQNMWNVERAFQELKIYGDQMKELQNEHEYLSKKLKCENEEYEKLKREFDEEKAYNVKLKSHMVKIDQYRKAMENYRKKKEKKRMAASNLTFQNALFRPIKSPPVTRRPLQMEFPEASGSYRGSNASFKFLGSNAAFGPRMLETPHQVREMSKFKW